MFARLCQSVQNIIKREIRFYNIPRQRDRYAVKLAEVIPFIDQLSKVDLEDFEGKATFATGMNGQDKRSVVIPLVRPLVIEGKEIAGLRLKAVMPQVCDGNQIKAYGSGSGFSRRILEVAGENEIRVRPKNKFSEYDPWGTLRFSGVENEVEAALRLGDKITETLLGFGIFEGLEFDGEQVGFVIYGMERKDDLRVLGNLFWQLKIGLDAALDKAELAVQTGELLRAMHKKGLGHRFPHLQNYRVLPENKARLLDLDTARELVSIPENQRAAFLYLDLVRAVKSYQMDIGVRRSYDDESWTEYLQLTPLLPFFFWGYFGGDTNLAFVREIERFVNGDSNGNLYETFGRLPSYKEGWRSGGTFTLLEPAVQLFSSRGEHTVNLLDFVERPLFAQYHSALSQVAASL
jgi:hypothetical protein